MIRLRATAALLALAALAACDKNATQDLAAATPVARIKFFNFGVNAPGVNFYANDTKVTAISSTTGAESVTGTAYGAAGAAGLYTGIAAGQFTVTARIAAATDKDFPVASLPVSVADGKAYSVYLSGVYDPAAKKVDAFAVEDTYDAQINYGAASVRLVNAIYNAGPLTLYAKNTTTAAEVPVGAAVAYKAGGTFVTLPEGVYDLTLRDAAAAAVVTRTGVSFSAARVYTVGARGDLTSAVTANRPALDNTTNR